MTLLPARLTCSLQTSAIQRINFTDAVDWHWDRSSKTLEGSPAVTFFAPTNAAFRRIPRKLKFFLFSPFGARALQKILSLHVVPDYVLHSSKHSLSNCINSLTHLVALQIGYIMPPMTFCRDSSPSRIRRIPTHGCTMVAVTMRTTISC